MFCSPAARLGGARSPGGIAAMKPAAASIRLDTIGGHVTEVLEMRAVEPRLNLVFVPGNPGIIAFYQDYLAELFHRLDGQASITAVSHIGHTAKDWEDGKQYSLQQQIEHKAQLLQSDRFLNSGLPLVLVGHSIGAYIALELLKKSSNETCHVVGLFPFLKTNPVSIKQTFLKNAASNSCVRQVLGLLAGILGYAPQWLSKALVKAVYGRAWEASAVDVTCRYLLQPAMVRNFTYMGMTEFQKLRDELDWEFLKEQQLKISLLFGGDDHWGPLSQLKQIRQVVPGLAASVEEQKTSHDFCCSMSGSQRIASYTADVVIKSCMKQ